MRLVDCFLYNNEDLILEVRLNTLNKYVDNFVIVESKFDHQGNKKKLNFNFSNYKKFEHKIKYLVIDKFPENMSSWDRENYQRNYINKGIQEFNEDDYIMISDVDEIPNLKEIKNLDKYKFTVFQQKLFFYKFNAHNTTTPFWFGSKICKKKYLKSPQWLRKQKVKKNPFWKFYKVKWNIIKDGGWHFSFLMDAHQIEAKLNSFAHEEYNSDYFKNLERINYSIDNNIDLFNRGFTYKKIDFDESFPKYIFDNKKKFKNWIL
jgi:beta-1,4-mannosyl-glycoprotein beta-1,4-N-acetylglucosaminyltransferase|tara:strand:+ start:73 stop:858 length:786 start_codon:yes stop_codon:yes gene_type:complete